MTGLLEAFRNEIGERLEMIEEKSLREVIEALKADMAEGTSYSKEVLPFAEKLEAIQKMAKIKGDIKEFSAAMIQNVTDLWKEKRADLDDEVEMELVEKMIDTYKPEHISIEHPDDNNGAAAYSQDVSFKVLGINVQFTLECQDHEEPPDIITLYVEGVEDPILNQVIIAESKPLEEAKEKLGVSGISDETFLWVLWAMSDPRPVGAYVHEEWEL